MKVSMAEAETRENVITLMSDEDAEFRERFFVVFRKYDETVWQAIWRGDASEPANFDEAMGVFAESLREPVVN